MTSPVDCVFEGICYLGEGPLWNAAEGRLYWTDVFGSRIWVHDPADGGSRVFWEGEHQVGGFAFTRKGGMVLCTDRGVYMLSPGKAQETRAEPQLLFDVRLQPGEAFNDITVDPRGRIFAGTLIRGQSDGRLLRLERDREPVEVLSGVACSNGMTFSLDERTFFHTDSMPRRITRYDYCADTGEVCNPSVFFQGEPDGGLPDGLTLDSEDHLWSAFWGASAVRRLDPSGGVVDEVEVPARQPSSVMFGGRDLRDLYITSACQGAADLEAGTDEDGGFLGGPVYRWRAPVKGREEWLADF